MRTNRFITIAVISAILLCLCSCVKKEDRIQKIDYADFSHVAANFVLNPNEDNEIALLNMIDSHPTAYHAMAEVMNFDADNINEWLSLPAITAFAHDVDSLSESSDAIKKMIASVVATAEKEGLELPVNSFASVIWGKPQSIMFCDSCMLIAMNHYLGSDHPAYNSLDSYRRQTKSPQAMPYDIVEALLATEYPFERSENGTLINRLIYEGVITEAKMRMVKNASLADALGYTSDQLKLLEENESEIWNKMVGSKMIFDASETLSEKFVSPAPFTSPLSPEVPGRAGRYIGYMIVKAFLEDNPKTRLSDLIIPEFYNKENPLAIISYNPAGKR